MSNLPNLLKSSNLHIQEAQQIPSKINTQRDKIHKDRHITAKMLKVKDEKILKTARKKQLITCKGTWIRLMADVSTETMDNRR